MTCRITAASADTNAADSSSGQTWPMLMKVAPRVVEKNAASRVNRLDTVPVPVPSAIASNHSL